MTALSLAFSVRAKIARPPRTVFQALTDPEQLNAYFTRSCSAPLRAGATVTWTFPDVAQEFTVHVDEVVEPTRIAFRWGPRNVHVAMTLEEIPTGTRVVIRASGWPPTQADLDDSYEECSGWQQVLCSMQVWLEHGLRL